jgi:apolipoprotein N-acyltransferase
LLVLSFAPFSCATCGWIALVPAWWVITRSEKAQRQPIRHGYLIGLIYFGGTFWWIGNVTVIGTIALIFYLALYPALWFLLVTRFLGGTTSWSSAGKRTGRSRSLQGMNMRPLFQAIAAAALWGMLEWWRSWFLTGFNWNELGDSQAPSIVFRQLAAFGGVPLISFVLVMVNILWAEGILAMIETFREKKVIRASLPFAAALLLVAICFALGWHHRLRHRGETLRPGLSYACVQPNIPQIPPGSGETENDFQNREDHALQTQQQLSALALASKPDLLIWPEAIIDEGIFQDRPLNEAVHQIATDFDGYFLLGSQDFDQHKLYNCAYLFGPGWDRFQYYRKTKLVILGEYLPFGDTFPWLRKAVGIGMDFTPGQGPKKFGMEKPAMTFSPLICFEDTLPEVADKAARLRPDFFVTITNDGWYQGWTAAWGVRQHLAHAVFRCVEHDCPMIRCANNGISCEINQDGTVIDRLRDTAGSDVDVGGVFARKLEFYPAHATFHEAQGDWIILISALISGMLGLQFFYRFCARSCEP